MQACVLHAVGDLRHDEVPTPMPGPGEVLLRVGACGVCGSDIPRVYEKGTYSFPTIPGHEFSGTVTAVGAGVDPQWVGRACAVFPLLPCRTCAACALSAYAQCEQYGYLGSRNDGAFAEYVRVPVWNLLPLPEGVSLEEGAFVEPAAVALHALRQGRLTPGETAVIYGCGPIGLLAGLWARVFGARQVLMIDVDLERLRFAKRLGFTHLFDAGSGAATDWVRQRTGRGADLVIEAAGTSPALESAVRSARMFGRVVLLGNPAGAMQLSQEAYWAVLRQELTLTGSWNSVYADAPLNEWKLVLDYIAEGALQVKPLITHRVSLQNLPDALDRVRKREEFSVKVMFVDGA